MKKVIRILIFVLCTAILVQDMEAQDGDFTVYQCEDSMSVINLVDSVFFSSLPTQNIQNLTFRGDPRAVGYFENGNFLNFESGRGIVLSTGLVQDIDKSNVCSTSQNASTNNIGIEGDTDLSLISGGAAIHDVCIIEFDFKPITNFVEFNYVFASEEYNEYVFASFNDVFGLFISGYGIDGPYTNDSENIALLPDSVTVISIDNVNKGVGGSTCTTPPTGCTNCEYFIDNSSSNDPNFQNFVFDAFTTKLSASKSLSHKEWYHIKIAIGDAGDAIFDSAIFLDNNSFKTGTITASPWYMSPK